MGLFSEARPAEVLHNLRPQLDRIFEGHPFEVVDDDECLATVRSAKFDLAFSYDRNRVRDVSTSITFHADPSDWQDQVTIDLWARFLDKEIPLLPTNRSGIVTTPLAEQIQDGLSWVACFAKEIFADPQRSRDACFYVAGYMRAYNDRASRRGAWSGLD